MKLTECLDRLLDEGLVSNIAVRVGRFDTVLADVYRSADRKIDENTRFDMASVTKVMATTPLALMALEQGAFTLDTPVSAFFRDARRLTIRHLLTHTIGIGHKPLNLAGNTYDNIADHILSIPADIPAGTDVLYSCPGFILLGKILEQIYGRRLDVLFMERIAAPLKLTRSRFLPGDDSNTVNSNVSDAEIGLVNDYNCRFLGGVAGNAGLFSCIADAEKYVRALLNGGAPLLKRETLAAAFRNYTPTMSESRALGFVYVDEKYAQTGRLFPAGSIGHCGHTGQSIFFDPKSGLYALILSDATRATVVKYGGERYDLVMDMRARIHNALADSGLF